MFCVTAIRCLTASYLGTRNTVHSAETWGETCQFALVTQQSTPHRRVCERVRVLVCVCTSLYNMCVCIDMVHCIALFTRCRMTLCVCGDPVWYLKVSESWPWAVWVWATAPSQVKANNTSNVLQCICRSVYLSVYPHVLTSFPLSSFQCLIVCSAWVTSTSLQRPRWASSALHAWPKWSWEWPAGGSRTAMLSPNPTLAWCWRCSRTGSGLRYGRRWMEVWSVSLSVMVTVVNTTVLKGCAQWILSNSSRCEFGSMCLRAALFGNWKMLFVNCSGAPQSPQNDLSILDLDSCSVECFAFFFCDYMCWTTLCSSFFFPWPDEPVCLSVCQLGPVTCKAFLHFSVVKP